MTPRPKQPRKHLQISEEEFAKLSLQYKDKKSLMDKLMSVSMGRATPRMEIRPIMQGSTDSSQRMIDFTEARRMGLPAGDVDKYRSHRNAV